MSDYDSKPATLAPPTEHSSKRNTMVSTNDSEPTLAPTEVPEKDLKLGESTRDVSRASSITGRIEVDSQYEGKEKAVTTEKTEEGASSDEEIEYPSAWKLAMITLALCLVVFLIALDQTIIATAIPAITNQFNSLTDVAWYGSAYMLTMCSFQLIFGKIYTFFSLKWCFIGCVVIFEIGSLICAVAPNSEVLIVGRAIAGLGCSGIFSGSLIILAHSVPLHQRPLYTGLIGGMFGIASVAGPLLGGVFTDSHLTWRWCFYINLPIGAVTLLIIGFLFTAPNRKKVDKITTKEKLAQFDFIGTLFLLPTIICLLLALQWGGVEYEWSNARIIVLFVLAGVFAAVFVFIQFKRGETATLPPRVLSQRSIAFSSLIALCIGSAFFILVFFIPIWFQAVQGVSATQSGIRNIPLILAVTVFSIIGGGVVTALGYYVPFMIAGPIIATIGAGLLTTWVVDSNPGQWIGYQILAGAGIGLVMQQPMIAAQTAVKLEDVPTAVAIVIFSQTFGGALFLAVGQNVFNNQLIVNLAKYAPEVDPVLIFNSGATQFRSIDQLQPYLEGIKWAYNEALTYTFYPSIALFGAAFFFALGVEWISVKGKKIEIAGA